MAPDPQELVRDLRAWWGDTPSDASGRIFRPEETPRVAARFAADNPRWAEVPRLARMIWVINEGGWDQADGIVRWVPLSRAALRRLEA